MSSAENRMAALKETAEQLREVKQQKVIEQSLHVEKNMGTIAVALVAMNATLRELVDEVQKMRSYIGDATDCVDSIATHLARRE